MPVCAESDREPLLRASFDGINDTGEPVELKVPSEKTYREVRDHGRASIAYRLYEPQVQHQLYVAGADKGWLVFYQDAQQQTVFEIPRDPNLIRAIVGQGLAFWDAIVTGDEPEKNLTRDLFVPPPQIADEWAVLADRYRSAWTESKRIEANLKQRKDTMDAAQTALVALMGDALLAESAGLRITRFCAKGSVDYPALLKALLPELKPDGVERFRRKPSERVRVTVQEDERQVGDCVRCAAETTVDRTGWRISLRTRGGDELLVLTRLAYCGPPCPWAGGLPEGSVLSCGRPNRFFERSSGRPTRPDLSPGRP